MLSGRNPRLPLHHVADLSELTFKPESIVAYLAALGDECSEREEQMLVRFLSACRMRSFIDQRHKSIVTLRDVIDQNGPWVAVFSTPEAHEHAQQRAQLDEAPWSPTVVSVPELLVRARYSSVGLALDPFSAHVRTIPWDSLRSEHEHFRRGSEWSPPVAVSDQPMISCIWDTQLINNLQHWLTYQHGVAQLVVAAFGDSAERARITIMLDCVPSVHSQCERELQQLLLFGSHTLPVDQGFIQVKLCNDESVLKRLVQRGALSLTRDGTHP